MKTSPNSTEQAPTAVNPIPDGMHTVTPYLTCANAVEAMAFYKEAFNATEINRVPGPDGKLLHGALRIGDSIVMLSDEFPEMNALGPKARNGTSVTIHLYVEDADAWFARAVKAGATAKLPPEDAFWGDRYGIVEDPFGHSWSIATHIRDLTPEEISEAAKNACSS